MLSGKTIVLGVTGSVAAYKMANMASMLIKRGCEVHVIMTENATNFINPIAFESLTNTKCLVETFDRNFQFHVEMCIRDSASGHNWWCVMFPDLCITKESEAAKDKKTRKKLEQQVGKKGVEKLEKKKEKLPWFLKWLE